jgi:dynein heavy chain
MLPEVLNCVRMIFELSNYYNNSDRMRGLMTRISNQIIQRCKAKIEKEDMLGRDVEKCMSDLDESIECCKQWKEIADHKMRMIKQNSTRAEHWDLEKDETIFAEIDAFIQRCRDLKEICDGQLQFAQRGASCEMPIFGSTKGKEYQLNLEDLKLRFDVSLRTIENLDYDILDVKQTKWHDDFGQNFKEEVKGIETFYTTIINNIFKYVSTCSDAVEMLENFQQLSKRASV